jgi:hypothetical protein
MRTFTDRDQVTLPDLARQINVHMHFLNILSIGHINQSAWTNFIKKATISVPAMYIELYASQPGMHSAIPLNRQTLWLLSGEAGCSNPCLNCPFHENNLKGQDEYAFRCSLNRLLLSSDEQFCSHYTPD